MTHDFLPTRLGKVLLVATDNAQGNAFFMPKDRGVGKRHIVVDGNLGGGTVTIEGSIDDSAGSYVTLGEYTEGSMLKLDDVSYDMYFKTKLEGATEPNIRVNLFY